MVAWHKTQGLPDLHLAGVRIRSQGDPLLHRIARGTKTNALARRWRRLHRWAKGENGLFVRRHETQKGAWQEARGYSRRSRRSISEEDAVNVSDVVPFLPESKLIALGANFVKGPDFAPFAVEDGRLITGQNPASFALVAQGLMKKANGQHAPYVD